MPRLVTKFKYMKPGSGGKPMGGYAKYIATREGVEKIDDSQRHAPATIKQQELIMRILRDFPDAKESHEYEDYRREKTVGNASEFITRALEENMDRVADSKTYADYIATRPRAERFGSHAAQFHLPGQFAPIASWDLVREAAAAAEKVGATYHVGNLSSSDVFYGDHIGVPEGLDSVYGLKKMGVMALEMEAAALYMNAARYGKRGLSICTVSDHILKGEATTAEERQNAFTTMMTVALDVAVAMENK